MIPDKSQSKSSSADVKDKEHCANVLLFVIARRMAPWHVAIPLPKT
jgi:hypothetical protein